MPARIILVRHVLTEYNDSKRYCSFTDIGLNEAGVSQAKRLAKRLANENITGVYTSGAKRAQQFAHIALPGLEQIAVPGLGEINFGIFEGLTHDQIVSQYEEIYSAWLKNPIEVTIPKGENVQDLANRTWFSLEQIAAENSGKTVAVFTHSGPLRIVFCEINNIEVKDIWTVIPGSGSLSIIEMDQGHIKGILMDDMSYQEL
jgi:broad specificity phosphatase PhoE